MESYTDGKQDLKGQSHLFLFTFNESYHLSSFGVSSFTLYKRGMVEQMTVKKLPAFYSFFLCAKSIHTLAERLHVQVTSEHKMSMIVLRCE